MQLRSAILSRKFPCALLSSVISVVAPFILLKFSLNWALSRRSLMIPISLGLCAGYNLSKAKTNLPTYHTSSNTLLNPREINSRVISKMTLVASGLFIASRSMILQNISCVKDWGHNSMNLRCRARISTKMGGEFVTSGRSSFNLTRNYGFSSALNSVCFVLNLSSCNGLCCSCVSLICAISWMRVIISHASLGNLPSRCLEITASISLVYYESPENIFLCLKKAISSPT